MNENDIKKTVASIVDFELGEIIMEPEKTLDERGADSLDRMSILMQIEEKFNLSIDDQIDETWKTTDDIVNFIKDKAKNGNEI